MKNNKLPKKLFAILFFLNLILVNFIFVGNTLASTPPKAKDFKLDLNIAIPGAESTYTVGDNMLGQYIRAWYNFMLGTIGILAAVMIMVGGFKYLTSQGDKGQIQTAQNTIISAITGLVLAFGMHAILSLVNPDLLTLKMPPIKGINYTGTHDGQIIPPTPPPTPPENNGGDSETETDPSSPSEDEDGVENDPSGEQEPELPEDDGGDSETETDPSSPSEDEDGVENDHDGEREME